MSTIYGIFNRGNEVHYFRNHGIFEVAYFSNPTGRSQVLCIQLQQICTLTLTATSKKEALPYVCYRAYISSKHSIGGGIQDYIPEQYPKPFVIPL